MSRCPMTVFPIDSLFGGVAVTGGSVEWVVVTIDFANTFPRDCGANDYYQWTPSDQVGVVEWVWSSSHDHTLIYRIQGWSVCWVLW